MELAPQHGFEPQFGERPDEKKSTRCLSDPFEVHLVDYSRLVGNPEAGAQLPTTTRESAFFARSGERAGAPKCSSE